MQGKDLLPFVYDRYTLNSLDSLRAAHLPVLAVAHGAAGAELVAGLQLDAQPLQGRLAAGDEDDDVGAAWEEGEQRVRKPG